MWDVTSNDNDKKMLLFQGGKLTKYIKNFYYIEDQNIMPFFYKVKVVPILL